jgi:hypoxanthine phosphoribosyltransferase
MELATTPIPAMQDLEQILFTPEQLSQRVAELGAEISRDYEGRDLVMISVLKGGVIFLADLIRQVTIPHQIELVGASTYKGGTAPTPGVRITKDVDLNLAGRDVLLVEDVYDTGNTLHVVHDLLSLHRPASLTVCALLQKKKAHSQRLEVKYLGFEIEDCFVVGYGLDYKEHYRNLPCIGILKSELYQ